MSEVTLKVFGVFRSDTHISCEKVKIEKIADLFPILNSRIDSVYAETVKTAPDTEKPGKITFSDAIVYINGDKCSKKSRKPADGDEIWVMSPASGG